MLDRVRHARWEVALALPLFTYVLLPTVVKMIEKTAGSVLDRTKNQRSSALQAGAGSDQSTAHDVLSPSTTPRRRNVAMPRAKHLRGVGAKEQRQYEHIKESAEKTGRYGRRAKEVAARTVMKQHKSKGHPKGR